MIRNDIIIKKLVDLEDLLVLEKIGKRTFYETFADSNTHEDMQKYLNESFSLNKLTNELTNTQSEFYLAILDNAVIGYMKLNIGQAQTEIKDNHALEIERIYVLKDFHGQQIGQVLYTTALQVAVKMNVDYLWLGVWEKNTRAINFYKKNGFLEFDKHLFLLGNDKQTDILMRLQIKQK